MKFYHFLFSCLLLCFGTAANAQTDTLQKGAGTVTPLVVSPVNIDSLKQVWDQQRNDSLQKKVTAYLNSPDSNNYTAATMKWFKELTILPIYKEPVLLTMQERRVTGDEPVFYIIIALLFFYGLVRSVFIKYHNNLMALFFRATLRQQQLRDQLTQTPAPSLMLNALFLFSASLYTSFLAKYYQLLSNWDFWEVFLYSAGGLLVLYTGKFIVMKIIGWILRADKAADAYIFVVFMINKVLGIFLIPIIMLMAFPTDAIIHAVVVLSLALVVGLFVYRFWLSYRAVRGEIKVNPFHFFLYLCAFEIAPLLLLFKFLTTIVERNN
ncbi:MULTISPECIES: DUF4271 domain-containing protein [unclassified Paraflavitalea]|uniref:DUF4271 domain-containing protein n=1 Tax=unclassified Paraflavitalea TaxID=2798305 RepID=UPI003D3368DA